MTRRRAIDWPQEWISVSAYAQKYGIDRTTVYKWIRQRLLETFKVENVLRVRDQIPRTKAEEKQSA